MKAVRLHKFHTQPVIDDVPEPTISGPFDVIVKIGGAGVCRTDLHIIEGQWDAGITAYHAVRKAIPLLYPGTTCVVIGAGGLGHIGIQCLATLTATNIIVVDRNPDALKLASDLGAAHTVVGDGSHVDAVKDLTGGQGADVVLDFV